MPPSLRSPAPPSGPSPTSTTVSAGQASSPGPAGRREPRGAEHSWPGLQLRGSLGREQAGSVPTAGSLFRGLLGIRVFPEQRCDPRHRLVQTHLQAAQLLSPPLSKGLKCNERMAWWSVPASAAQAAGLGPRWPPRRHGHAEATAAAETGADASETARAWMAGHPPRKGQGAGRRQVPVPVCPPHPL